VSASGNCEERICDIGGERAVCCKYGEGHALSITGEIGSNQGCCFPDSNACEKARDATKRNCYSCSRSGRPPKK
jgi:hypothetical protein